MRASASHRISVPRAWRFILVGFAVSRWRLFATLRRTFPLAVRLKRFLAYTVGWQDYAISTGEMVIKLGKDSLVIAAKVINLYQLPRPEGLIP